MAASHIGRDGHSRDLVEPNRIRHVRLEVNLRRSSFAEALQFIDKLRVDGRAVMLKDSAGSSSTPGCLRWPGSRWDFRASKARAGAVRIGEFIVSPLPAGPCGRWPSVLFASNADSENVPDERISSSTFDSCLSDSAGLPIQPDARSLQNQ
jgi:hypothetical protein